MRMSLMVGAFVGCTVAFNAAANCPPPPPPPEHSAAWLANYNAACAYADAAIQPYFGQLIGKYQDLNMTVVIQGYWISEGQRNASYASSEIILPANTERYHQQNTAIGYQLRDLPPVLQNNYAGSADQARQAAIAQVTAAWNAAWTAYWVAHPVWW